MMTALLAASARGENRIVTEKDSSGRVVTRIIELNDTVIDGKAVTDTLSVTTYDFPTEWAADVDRAVRKKGILQDSLVTISDTLTMILIFGMCGFALPLLIVLAILFFRYKSRKAKYRLAEKALEAGQPLPADFCRKTDVGDIRSRGIKNVFLGLGLFIFLWALTETFGLGCIGLLVMFTGFGQLVIYYAREKEDNSRNTPDETA